LEATAIVFNKFPSETETMLVKSDILEYQKCFSSYFFIL